MLTLPLGDGVVPSVPSLMQASGRGEIMYIFMAALFF